jgi:nitronate monooxygenase
MDARGIVGALALGAAGVQMGTAFLTARESGINAAYRQAVLQTASDRTRLTRAFSGHPARGIQNRFMHEMAGYDALIPPFPMQNALTLALRQAAAEAGQFDSLSLWAGQAAALAVEHDAGEFVRSLAGERATLMIRLGDNHS